MPGQPGFEAQHKMTANDSFPQNGLIVAGNDEPADDLGELAYAVLDDIMYNIIHDIVLNTHREEKMARANSAAIIVEQMVEEAVAGSLDENMAGTDPAIVKTEAAVYNHGEVFLTGNPLKTVHEIRCPKCNLPRLLHPTDGNGAKKPEPGVEYCKKRPFIDKPYHDIYGQTFVPEGPGRGKKKKDMINPLKAQTTKESTPSGSQESPGTSPPPSEGPAKPIPFPHAKCHNCNTFLPIKRMNNHMVKCIGGGGRDSSRTALLKIQNGNSNGSQNGTTPPGSRNGTPIPAGAYVKGKSSPNKREAGDDFDSDSSPQKKKKLIKKTAATKLKAPKMMKSASQISSSNLSFEQKVPNSDDEDDDGDDDNDGEYGTVIVEPKKKLKGIPKKGKEILGSKKKWLHGKGGVKPNLPPVGAPDLAKIKVRKAEGDPESESSQTLSSPN